MNPKDEYEDMTWEEFFNLTKQGWKNFELHNEEVRRREERLNNKQVNKCIKIEKI